MSILNDILTHKAQEVESARMRKPLREIKTQLLERTPVRSLQAALRREGFSIIAEVKHASPSRGIIREKFQPVEIAEAYEREGATAISVLTDERFFGGQAEYLRAIKQTVSIPVLRKDFIVDEYQIYESRLLGADAILLIVKALPLDALRRFYETARSLDLDVLVETHTKEEIERANNLGAEIIGINNRNLETFDVSLDRSLKMRSLIHAHALSVSESGIKEKADVQQLMQVGFHAALIGEGLVAAGEDDSSIKTFLKK